MTSRTVLVVGDPRPERDRTCAVIRELGFEPVALDTSEQCLDSLEQLQPVAVIVELRMSQTRGDECCRLIKENFGLRSVPVIISTSSDQPHELMHIWRAAADDFLIVPVDPAHLRSKLEVLSRQEPEPAPQDAQKVSSVLFAEPSRFFRKMLGENLQHAGVQVLYALDGDEALDLAQEHSENLDACLLDLSLPGMNGVELVEALAETPTLQSKPIVVFSASQPAPDVVDRIRQLTGSEPVLKKEQPFDYILSRVRGTLRREAMNLRASERMPFFSMIEFSTDRKSWLTGFSYDVSAGGLFIRTLNPVPAGSPIHLRVRFAGYFEPCVSSGVVAWSNPYRPRGSFAAIVGMGIQITDMAPQLWNQISRLVQKGANAGHSRQS